MLNQQKGKGAWNREHAHANRAAGLICMQQSYHHAKDGHLYLVFRRLGTIQVVTNALGHHIQRFYYGI